MSGSDPSAFSKWHREGKKLLKSVLPEISLLPDGLNRARKRKIHMFVDAILILAAFAAALILNGAPASQLSDPLTWAVVVPVVPVCLITFNHFGLYRAILRFITGNAMRSVVVGAVAGAATMLAIIEVLGGPVSPAVAVIHAMTVLLAVGGIRFWGRAVLRSPGLRKSTPVIIYGAGNAGQQLVAALYLSTEYVPVALVDDDARLHGTTINGVRVYSPVELRTLIAHWQVREVLMALPSLSRMRRRRIVAKLERLGVEVKTIPGMGDVVSGRAQLTDLRSVMPEELLGRDPVPPRASLMQRNITGKAVLVTGAGGSIGSELCRQIIAQKPKVLVMLDVSEYALYSVVTELRDSGGDDAANLVPVLGSVQNPRSCGGSMCRPSIMLPLTSMSPWLKKTISRDCIIMSSARASLQRPPRNVVSSISFSSRLTRLFVQPTSWGSASASPS